MNTTSPSRRGLRYAAALIALGMSVAGLTACSGDSGSSSSSSESSSSGSTGEATASGSESSESESTGATPLATASFQLGWLPNVESMAPITAVENGYFAEEGTEVTLLPGGPEVTTDAQIVSGNALMGTLSSESLANSVLAGAPLVAVGAIYQTSSSAIIAKADSGIAEPKDLEGRKFGVSQTDDRVYTPFFALTGVDASKVEMVSSGNDPAALISGEVDAISGTLPNQPVAIAAQGIEVTTIRLADYGYNRWSNLLVVRQDSLEDPEKRATIVGMLKAITKALEEAVADPTAAAQTVYDVYGEQLGLDLEQQKASAAIWAELAADGTKEQGVVRLTEDGVASQQSFFDAIGIAVTASDIFDLSVQDEE